MLFQVGWATYLGTSVQHILPLSFHFLQIGSPGSEVLNGLPKFTQLLFDILPDSSSLSIINTFG